MSAKLILRGGTLLLSLIGVVILVRLTGLDAHLDETWIDTYVRGQGIAGILVFVAAGGLVTGVGLPRQLFAFLGGYAFGIVEGTGLAILATLAGCIASFYYARFLGRDLIAGRFPGKVKQIDAFLAENPFSMTLLIRFLPFGSNLITNLAAGVSTVPGLPYFAASAVGYLPQTLIFDWLHDFGRCVQLLGETLSSLRRQIEVQQRRFRFLCVLGCRAHLVLSHAQLRWQQCFSCSEARAPADELSPVNLAADGLQISNWAAICGFWRHERHEHSALCKSSSGFYAALEQR